MIQDPVRKLNLLPFYFYRLDRVLYGYRGSQGSWTRSQPSSLWSRSHSCSWWLWSWWMCFLVQMKEKGKLATDDRVDLLGGAHVLVRHLADGHPPCLQHLQYLLPVGCLGHGRDVKNDPVRHFLFFFWLLLCLEIWWQMTGEQVQLLI